jgi:hypothetical protein
MKEKPWYQQQLRILQTVLREPDVVGYDAKDVVRYMSEVHANCIIINAGGIVDFFRHDMPTANPNPFMTNEDILKDITDECHKRGIKVVVRVDFRGVDKRIYELHPDWFAVNEQGEPLFYTSPTIPNPLYRPCYLGYYRNEYAIQYMEMLLQKYELDGIWENSYHEHGICYCQTCKTVYREQYGEDLPHGGSFRDSRYDNYRTLKEIYYTRHLAESQAAVKKYGDDKVYCSEAFGFYYESYREYSANLYNIRDHFDFLVTPMFVANHQTLNGPASLMKFLKSLAPEKTPIMLFGHLGTNNELRYVSKSPAESRIWMWQAVSGGGSLWSTIFNGQHPDRTHDRRSAYLCRDVYAYMEEHEDKLTDQEPVADVTVYYSMKTSKRFAHGKREEDSYITHLIGLEQALLDRRIQFNFINDRSLTAADLQQVKVLAIPNAACLSDEEIGLIRNYVKQGGKLLATYQTSMFQPDGTFREDYALKDVFGCSYTGITKDGSHYGYQYIRDQQHPITAGMDKTELLANWGPNLLVRMNPGSQAETPVTYVPQIYPQSPERSWLRSLETDYPTAVVNRFGSGESVYFPYGVDKQALMHGHHDFKDLLGNAFQYLVGPEQRLQSTAPSSVHFTLNRDPNRHNRYILHAVNMTSAPVRPMREIIPVGDIKVELILDGSELKLFSVLRGDSGIQVTQSEKLTGSRLKVQLTIPVIEEYAGMMFETE